MAPSDAAVVKPVLTSQRGIVLGCGYHAELRDYDTYHMAASAIDEAIRNCVAVGADPAKIAILDNFCWAIARNRRHSARWSARQSLATMCDCDEETPFISGKDSLNNEFRITDDSGNNKASRFLTHCSSARLGR